jgi:hypothetical protein
MNPFRNGGAAAIGVVALGFASPFASDAGAAPEQHCPAGALVLPANAAARAAKAALFTAASHYPTLNTTGAKVVSAKRGSAVGPRGAEVGRQCGAKAEARTVVVELRFPRMAPSASLSEGVVVVARFAGGYRIWAIEH